VYRRYRGFVRRFLAVVLLVAGTGVVVAGPAAAHQCARAAEVPVGVPQTVRAWVTVETKPVTDVEITVPAGLELDRAEAKPGWKPTVHGSTVRYRGGPIPAYGCEDFPIRVTASAKGAYGIHVVQRDATGLIVAISTNDPTRPLDPNLQQVVYAGMKPPSPPGSGGGLSTTTIAGLVLVVLGVGLVGGLGLRAWRDRRSYDDTEASPDDDLQQRLEDFKKQTRGR
jgi:hypothetical protein